MVLLLFLQSLIIFKLMYDTENIHPTIVSEENNLHIQGDYNLRKTTTNSLEEKKNGKKILKSINTGCFVW